MSIFTGVELVYIWVSVGTAGQISVISFLWVTFPLFSQYSLKDGYRGLSPPLLHLLCCVTGPPSLSRYMRIKYFFILYCLNGNETVNGKVSNICFSKCFILYHYETLRYENIFLIPFSLLLNIFLAQTNFKNVQTVVETRLVDHQST